MKRFLLAAAIVALAAIDTQARDRRRPILRTVQATATATRGAVSIVAGSFGAMAKSLQQASQGRMAHVGVLQAGTYEGVGFSSSSPEQALAACCYSNSGLRVIDQAVVPGPGGWYATKIYSR